MDDYMGECCHLGCENEATTNGFVVVRPEKEGDNHKFHDVIACDIHAKMRGFFKHKEDFNERQTS